jgi:hypothetical protein
LNYLCFELLKVCTVQCIQPKISCRLKSRERGGGGKTPSIPARAGALHRAVAEKEREVHIEGPGYVLGTVLLYSLSSSRQRGEGGGEEGAGGPCMWLQI